MKDLLAYLAVIAAIVFIVVGWQIGYDWFRGRNEIDVRGGASAFWAAVLLIVLAILLGNCVYAISLKLWKEQSPALSEARLAQRVPTLHH